MSEDIEEGVPVGDIKDVVDTFVGKFLLAADFDEYGDFVLEFNDNSLMVVEFDQEDGTTYISSYEKNEPTLVN